LEKYLAQRAPFLDTIAPSQAHFVRVF